MTAATPLQITREALYERVWAEPMAILAPRFGLSDVGLKKACDRMRIPTPPRGYWAKIAAGQRLKRAPLPKLPSSAGTSALTVTFRQPPKPAAPIPEETGPVADQRRYEGLPEHRVVTPGQLLDPHPLVARAVVALRKAKADEQGRLTAHGQKLVALHVTMGSADRALRIYDTLFKALLVRGYPVELVDAEGKALTVVKIGDSAVPIELTEQVNRTELPPAPGAPSYAAKRYAYTPTGRLSLTIKEPYLDVRGKWSDGARQRVDEILNDIIVGLVENAEAMRLRRIRWEEAAREREAAEARRRAAEIEKQREGERIRSLDDQMRRWRKSAAVRAYVAAARAAAADAGASEHEGLVAWLSWAEQYADRIDPMSGGRIEFHKDRDATSSHYAPWNTPTEDTRPIW